VPDSVRVSGKEVEVRVHELNAISPTVPLTLVVLGAFFYNPPAPPSAASTNGNGHTSKTDDDKPSFFRRKLEAIKHPRASTTHPGENRTVFVAVISRMILVPAILLPGVALIARYDSFEAAEDPVFVLAAVLIISSVSPERLRLFVAMDKR